MCAKCGSDGMGSWLLDKSGSLEYEFDESFGKSLFQSRPDSQGRKQLFHVITAR
jgi:hypothetical protein